MPNWNYLSRHRSHSKWSPSQSHSTCGFSELCRGTIRTKWRPFEVLYKAASKSPKSLTPSAIFSILSRQCYGYSVKAGYKINLKTPSPSVRLKEWRRGRDSNPCEHEAHWLACPLLYYEDLEASAITTPPPRLQLKDNGCRLKTFSVPSLPLRYS